MKTSGTFDEMVDTLIEQLNREEPELRERHKQMFREAFERMAEQPIRVPTFLTVKARAKINKWLAEPEIESLSPLPPGRARIISF